MKIGVDIEDIKEFKNQIDNENFLKNIFSKKEIEYCKSKKSPEISLTGKFCAKEAVIKAKEGKLPLQEIEIINNKKGAPEVYISKKRQENIYCSISHTEKIAIAFILIED